MDEQPLPTKSTENTLIWLILVVALGVMVIVVISVLVKRQIMRFALKSSSEPHVSICYGVPRKMKGDVRRRIDRTKDVTHEPNLLHNEAKKHSPSSTDSDAVPHLYRMKALDHCKLLESRLTKDRGPHRIAGEEFDEFLRNHIHSLSVQIGESKLEEFYSLYRHARHEPKLFGQEAYNHFVSVVTEISNVVQGARMRHAQSPAIRPIADITELADEQLPNIARTPSNQFAFPIRQTVMGLAGKVFKKSQSKQEYQSVPSTESMEDINETTQL